MQDFKVGEWVLLTYSDGYLTTTLQRLIGISEDFYEFDHTINGRHAAKIKFSILELWQPKQGEWCWFRTCNCGFELGQFIEPLSNGYRYKLNSTNSLFNCNYCEPFIGELPYFLKEPIKCQN